MHGSFLNSKGLCPDPKVLKKNTVHVCSHYDREKENLGLNQKFEFLYNADASEQMSSYRSGIKHTNTCLF